jgi:hypothetical protein
MRAQLVASLADLPEPARAPPAADLPRTEGFPRAAVLERSRAPRRWRAAAVAAGVPAAIALGLHLAGGRVGVGAEDPGARTPARAEASASPLAQPAAVPQPPAPARAVLGAPEERAQAQPPSATARVRRHRVAEPRSDSPAKPALIGAVRGELNSIPTPPAATGDGVLVVVATPWANVEVDGVALGETPREVRLRAGTHGVRAVHPDLGIREERVVVGAGERRLWAARYEP